MNTQQKEIIEMARQVGVDMSLGEHWSFFIEELEAFYKLAAAKAWIEGYKQGVEDERTSEDNIGVAGFGMKVEPCRENPYALQARGEV